MTPVKFNQPPLVEVAFGVEFEAPEFSSVHFGLYWETIRDKFPLQFDKPPNIEDNTFFSMPPLRRVWFLSNDKRRLIQLQDNYFSYTWSQEDGEEYPHFEKIFPEFLEQWNHLKSWLSTYEGESIQLSEYELKYVNLIDESSGWLSTKDHHKIFTFVSKGFEDSLEMPKFINSQVAFPLPDNEGRLSVIVEQRIQESDDTDDNNDASEFVIFQLRAISFNADSELEPWFRAAHDYMIKAFLALTEEEAQRKWNRYEY